jgi:hypothetical protein
MNTESSALILEISEISMGKNILDAMEEILVHFQIFTILATSYSLDKTI